MAEDKKTVVIYTNWMTTFEKLSDEEAGMLIKHMFRYINDLNPDPPSRLLELVFEPFKQILKTDLRKYEEIKRKRSEAGKRGGAPKGNGNALKNSGDAGDEKTSKTSKRLKKQAKQPDTVTDTVTDTVLPKGNINIPVANAPVSLHTKCKNLFLSKYKELTGEEYYWDRKDAGNMNPIIKKITFNREKKKMPTDDESIESAFAAFLESIQDRWILDNFSIPNINSKFNEIISQAKSNGRTKQKPSTTDDELLASIRAGIARGIEENAIK